MIELFDASSDLDVIIFIFKIHCRHIEVFTCNSIFPKSSTNF